MDMQDTELQWPSNRPVSAHITIHYQEHDDDSGKDVEGFSDSGNANSNNKTHKVVKTVLNIDTDSLMRPSSMDSLRNYSLKEACGNDDDNDNNDNETFESDAVDPSPSSASRRPSNANSMNIHDLYQCVHNKPATSSCQYQYHGNVRNNQHVARRFSEPKLPNHELHFHYHQHQHHQHQHHLSCTNATLSKQDSPISRSVSYAADMDPTLLYLPRLTSPAIGDAAPRSATSEQHSDTNDSAASPSSSESNSDNACLDLSCPCTRHHHRRNSIAVKFNKALYKKS